MLLETQILDICEKNVLLEYYDVLIEYCATREKNLFCECEVLCPNKAWATITRVK